MRQRLWPLAAAWSLVLLTAVTAPAQPDETGGRRRPSFDTVIGVQDMLLEDADWPTQVIVDAAGSWQIGRHLFANVRPVVWRVMWPRLACV